MVEITNLLIVAESIYFGSLLESGPENMVLYAKSSLKGENKALRACSHDGVSTWIQHCGKVPVKVITETGKLD